MTTLNTDIHFAPVQGHTDAAYRRLHALHYSGVAHYYTPFIRLEDGKIRERDMRDMLSDCLPGGKCTAQVIFKDAVELEALLSRLHDAGVRSADLNLGCPFPLQTGRGRGAALPGNPAALCGIGSVLERYRDMEFSAKMRPGLSDPGEWELSWEFISRWPLTHLTVHPRLARQQYSGEPDMDLFKRIRDASGFPVIYNGDITTPDGFPPSCISDGVMIGRGLLGRPSLAEEYISGEIDRDERLRRMLSFHHDLMRHYEEVLCGETQVLSKIKPFWEYAEQEIGRKAWKEIRKAGKIAKYRNAVALIG